MHLIATVEGCDIHQHDDGSIRFRARARIDDDGLSPAHGDSCHDPNTSLHLNGRALNADVDKYIVVPPIIIFAVRLIVLGCQAHAAIGQRATDAVVGDVGPHKRLGEISRACALDLGINADPNRGGDDMPEVDYVLWPGKAALVDGKQYALQQHA